MAIHAATGIDVSEAMDWPSFVEYYTAMVKRLKQING